jgi:hypothetical protein
MSPGEVKEELERQQMTFAFVGQDMVPMRLMPFIKMGARGQYQWNAAFSGKRNRPAASIMRFEGQKRMKGEDQREEEENMSALLAAVDQVEMEALDKRREQIEIPDF